MSYMRGTDDADHKRHHARVTRGIPWNGRKEARVVEDGIPLAWSVKAERDTSSPANGENSNKTPTRHRPNSILPLVSLATRHAVREYRILVIDASTSGRLISEILRTVDTVLAAPELPREILARCKLFLATTACEPPAIPGAKRRPGPKPKENGAERIVGVVVSQSIKWAMRVLREGEKDDKAVDSGDGVFCE
jgi:N-acetyltransferase